MLLSPQISVGQNSMLDSCHNKGELLVVASQPFQNSSLFKASSRKIYTCMPLPKFIYTQNITKLLNKVRKLNMKENQDGNKNRLKLTFKVIVLIHFIKKGLIASQNFAIF